MMMMMVMGAVSYFSTLKMIYLFKINLHNNMPYLIYNPPCLHLFLCVTSLHTLAYSCLYFNSQLKENKGHLRRLLLVPQAHEAL